MIEVDSQMKMIIANLNDKLASITNECYKDKAYAGYIDEKLKSIEWDIKVLRRRVDKALEEEIKSILTKEQFESMKYEVK